MAHMPAALIPKEAANKALDHHIERLEAKLSFLIRSYDDSYTDLLLLLSSQYEKKIAIVKQEISDAVEQRQTLDKLRQISIIRQSTF